MMRPYLMERIFTPTMAGRCRVICKELGTQLDGGMLIFTHGSMHITKSWHEGLVIQINNVVLYRNDWMPGVKFECRQKIYNVIDDQFIKALDIKFARMEEQRKQEQRDADKRNQVCKEFSNDGV